MKRLENVKPEVEENHTASISAICSNLDVIEEAENVVKMIQENSNEPVDTKVSYDCIIFYFEN